VGRPRKPDALTAAQITKAYEERHDLVGMRVPRDVRDQIEAACKLRAVNRAQVLRLALGALEREADRDVGSLPVRRSKPARRL
jgi:hypothetical protein